MRAVNVDASKKYDVLIGEGLIDRSGELTAKVVSPCQCLIVTDDTVEELYADRVQISFSYAGFDVTRFTFPAGEISKNPDTLLELLNAMGLRHLSRSDLIVALGGGVTGDLTGFAAAIYARGIRFIQIPTTLLAAVDSSVGGKTGIDMPFGKNMVGAFHQPSLVITDIDVLRELPPEQLANGSAEAIKCGVLNDPSLFALLEGGSWLDDLEEIVCRCVTYKRDVIASDEFDTGTRMFLNLGHTFGHAIEACSGFTIPHGQAVGVGILMAASAADCPEALIRRLAACLQANGLATRCDYPATALMDAALGDKKRSGENITLVLPREIGRCELVRLPLSRLAACFEKALTVQEALGL